MLVVMSLQPLTDVQSVGHSACIRCHYSYLNSNTIVRCSLMLFIHSLHAFQSADQVRCSKHSMAALQPALSWDIL